MMTSTVFTQWLHEIKNFKTWRKMVATNRELLTSDSYINSGI